VLESPNPVHSHYILRTYFIIYLFHDAIFVCAYFNFLSFKTFPRDNLEMKVFKLMKINIFLRDLFETIYSVNFNGLCVLDLRMKNSNFLEGH
jgi:hypothetical protein